MKRIFSILLALTLMLALAVPAFATTPDWDGSWKNADKNSQDVTATYTAPVNNDGGKQYYVTISWTPNAGSDLSYTGKNATYTWDGKNMKYKETVNNAGDIGWKGSNGYKVEVINQSNASVDVATTASNDYNLTLTAVSTDDKMTVAEDKKATVTLTTAAVDASGGSIAITEIEKTGTQQKADVTYTYAGVGSATAPSIGSEATIIVGTISVTLSQNSGS